MDILQAFAEKAPSYHVLNAQVLRDGEIIARRDWDEEIRRNQYSASKSFTSAAVGLAVKEGLLTLDEKVVDAFAEEAPDKPSAFLLALTVRDLLTMCVGQEAPQLMGGSRPLLADQNWVRYALAQPFSQLPGSKFLYSNTGPYLAGILVQRRSGCNLLDYMMPRLFRPLGIRLPTWEMDPLGNTFGAGGLFLTVTEVARFTQLYLQQGQWKGKQILTREWVRESTSKQSDHGGNPFGYGYLFWLGPNETFRCDGKYGQYGIAVPSRNAVVAVNSECRDQDGLIELIYQEIITRL